MTRTAEIARTLDVIWQVSKTDSHLAPGDEIRGCHLLQKLVDENVPVLRHFYFTFLIEDMPIAFREQLVRTQYDHYWIQSGRITDWTNLRVESRDFESQEVAIAEEDCIAAIKAWIEFADAKGIAPEDYRHLVPLGAYHRGIWTANLESLITRFKKRTCWVAQSDYWLDVVTQAKNQIEDALGVVFELRPPCKGPDWRHTGCTIAKTMQDRLKGTDPLPVCPVYYCKESVGMHCDIPEDRIAQFEGIWGHDYSD